jgi:hypothetical protein
MVVYSLVGVKYINPNLKRLAKEIVVCDLEGDSVMEELNRAVKRVIATVQ